MEITHEKFNMKIGRNIMTFRIRKNYTREYLAELADISPKFLYEIEIGKKGCSSYILFMLANSLNVDVNFLLMDEEEINEMDKGHLYQMLNEWQKEKIDIIIKTLYEIVDNIDK